MNVWVGSGVTPALLPCCPAPAAPAPPTRLLLGCFAFRQRVNGAATGVACVLNGDSVAGVFFGFPTNHRSTAGAQGLALKDDVEGNDEELVRGRPDCETRVTTFFASFGA